MTKETNADCVAQATATALLGKFPRSHISVVGGLRCYVCYVQGMLDLRGRKLPPTVEIIIAWKLCLCILVFFSCYVGYVKLNCGLLGSIVFISMPCDTIHCKNVEQRRTHHPHTLLYVAIQVSFVFTSSALSCPIAAAADRMSNCSVSHCTLAKQQHCTISIWILTLAAVSCKKLGHRDCLDRWTIQVHLKTLCHHTAQRTV